MRNKATPIKREYAMWRFLRFLFMSGEFVEIVSQLFFILWVDDIPKRIVKQAKPE